ncbi:MAG: hypothetical protein NVSMB56_00070 [Pyrinomonadaceae bacterium]
MAYQVIARKWRPQSFEEVTGQEPITSTLKSAIEHERLHHAYLFSGARGVGKTTTARLLAKALNCHKSNEPTLMPCRIEDPTVCASCREIAEGRSIDVLEIDAASNTGVDSVRDSIINTINVRPARDRYKVFIIDEVHMLSTQAFNALLKTLEEPPPGIVFIMATTEAHKVPDTILSRCQQFEFRTIPTAKIAERLRLIANAEQIEIDDAALREIARAGAGSMRDAQSAFDQTISFSFGKKIAVETVENALGLASSEMLARTVAAIAGENAKDALAIVDELVARGHDLRNFCRDLFAYLRDLLVVKIAGVEAELTDTNESERRELARAGAKFSESDLTRFFHSLTETERTLRESLHPRYQLEIGLVKLVEMRRLAPLENILQRLNALENALRKGGNMPPSNAPNTSNAPSGTSSSSSRLSSGQGGGSVNRATEVGNEASTPVAPSLPIASTSSPASSLPVNRSAATKSRAEINAQSYAEDDNVPPFETLPASAPNIASSSLTSVAVKPVLELVTSSTAVDWSDSPNAMNGATSSPSFFDPPQIATETQMPRNMSPNVSQTVETPVIQVDATDDADTSRLVGKIKAALEEEHKPLLATALGSAREVGVDGEDVLIEFPTTAKYLRDTLAKPDNMKILQNICRTIFGRNMGLRIIVGNGAHHAKSVDGAQGHAPTPQDGSVVAFNRSNLINRSNVKPSEAETRNEDNSPATNESVSGIALTPTVAPKAKQFDNQAVDEQKRLIEEAKNHPRVKEALRIFGAEIIEVVKRDGSTNSH